MLLLDGSEQFDRFRLGITAYNKIETGFIFDTKIPMYNASLGNRDVEFALGDDYSWVITAIGGN